MPDPMPWRRPRGRTAPGGARAGRGPVEKPERPEKGAREVEATVTRPEDVEEVERR